ncbi:MAG: hypothetical protein HQL58_00955 [Magnetococcales bacterium]|nr:hypothetical protein [Magnetococcales bacterium]
MKIDKIHPYPLLWALLWQLLPCCPAQADNMVVIVHPANPITSLSPAQVSDLYLGRIRIFPNGQYAQVIDWSRDSPERQYFFQRINGMSLNQVNTYWARLTFTGRVLPPQSVGNSHEVLKVIMDNETAIGYINSSEVTPAVREVLRLHE